MFHVQLSLHVCVLLNNTYGYCTGDDIPRQQINKVTSFLDASSIYGSSGDRMSALRLNSGGRLRTGRDNSLPMNIRGLPNDNPVARKTQRLKLAGDTRANIQFGLTAMHTLWVREHNYIADRMKRVLKQYPRKLSAKRKQSDDDYIFWRARRLLIAELQVITMEEYLPAILGRPWMESKFTGEY